MDLTDVTWRDSHWLMTQARRFACAGRFRYRCLRNIAVILERWTCRCLVQQSVLKGPGESALTLGVKWQGTPPLKTHSARVFPAAVLGCERATGTLGAVSIGTRVTWEELGVEELEEEADPREKWDGEECEKWVEIGRARKTGYTWGSRTGHGGSPMDAVTKDHIVVEIFSGCCRNSGFEGPLLCICLFPSILELSKRIHIN